MNTYKLTQLEGQLRFHEKMGNTGMIEILKAKVYQIKSKKLILLEGQLRFHQQMGNTGMVEIIKARIDKLNSKSVGSLRELERHV